MGTKWKKWISWLSFALGVSLLLVGLGLILASGQFFSVALRDAFKADWQDTRYFQNVMTDRLTSFLPSYQGRAATPADMHENLKDDASVLYTVRKNGVLLYSNAPQPLDGDDVPGYGFQMHFNGKAVTAFKTDSSGKPVETMSPSPHGAPVDLSGWYLPGNNYPLTEEDAGTDIWLAAKDTPKTGVLFYNVVDPLRVIRHRSILKAATLLLGLALFVCYLFLRKSKADGDRWLARWTGKVWFECKLLALLVGVSCGCSGPLRHSLDGVNYLLIGFWLCYLFVNDCRYGDKPWRHSASAVLAARWQAAEAGLPSRGRLFRRGLLALAGLLPLAALAGLWLLRVFGFSLQGISFFLLPLLAAAAVVTLLLLPLLWYLNYTQRFAREVEAFSARIDAVRAGDLGSAPALPEDSGLRETDLALSGIQSGLRAALDDQMQSERMKIELISNVSHDLKTPLTSIISYTELLKQEEDLPDHVRDYIRILDEKAQRLKAMVQDVFEVSKAASGALPVAPERLDFGKLIDQTLADMAEAVDASGLTFKVDLPRKPVFIQADGDRLYRVFQNLFQNALQYSLPGSRVYVVLTASETGAEAAVKNVSRDELPSGVDLTARFVRGDASRTDGGSGLGLAIASSFTAACGGSFRVETDADRFTALVSFPLSPIPCLPYSERMGEVAPQGR